MGPRASQDLRSPSPIMAPGGRLFTVPYFFREIVLSSWFLDVSETLKSTKRPWVEGGLSFCALDVNG